MYFLIPDTFSISVKFIINICMYIYAYFSYFQRVSYSTFISTPLAAVMTLIHKNLKSIWGGGTNGMDERSIREQENT